MPALSVERASLLWAQGEGTEHEAALAMPQHSQAEVKGWGQTRVDTRTDGQGLVDEEVPALGEAGTLLEEDVVAGLEEEQGTGREFLVLWP
jgi:hypothetical protein